MNKHNNIEYTLDEITELCIDGQDPKEIYDIIQSSNRQERRNNLKHKKLKEHLKTISGTNPRFTP